MSDESPIQSGQRGWVFPQGLKLCDLWLTLDMAVALSYKGRGRVGLRRGSVGSVNSCTGWLTAEELPANSPHCFCILFPCTEFLRQLSFYYRHYVCAQRGFCKWRLSAPERAGFPCDFMDKASLAQGFSWQVPQTQSALIIANTSLARLQKG